MPWSEAQGRVLGAILLAAEGLHLRAIANRTGLSYSAVQREVDRLERAHLVGSTKVHTARVVRANASHPLFPELRALLHKAYGPREVIRELLQGEAVESVYLFGSWAARYAGEWGEPPADIDVLVIGELTTARVEELEVEAEDALGQPVQITVVRPDDWRVGEAPFIRTVKERPMVPVVGEAA